MVNTVSYRALICCNIRYVAPTVQEEPLTGYKIRYWESDKDVRQANDTTVYIGSYDFKLEATISDLSPGKTYYLRVLAFSQGGEGKKCIKLSSSGLSRSV